MFSHLSFGKYFRNIPASISSYDLNEEKGLVELYAEVENDDVRKFAQNSPMKTEIIITSNIDFLMDENPGNPQTNDYFVRDKVQHNSPIFQVKSAEAATARKLDEIRPFLEKCSDWKRTTGAAFVKANDTTFFMTCFHERSKDRKSVV